MVILTISVNARSSKRNELLSAFRLFSDVTSREKGCSGCRIFQDIDDENFITLEENWENRSHLDAYFCSDVFSALLGAMKLLGKHHGIRINGGTPEDGMTAVKHASKE